MPDSSTSGDQLRDARLGDIEVSRVREGIHAIRLPLPFRTEPVNAWALEDDDGSLVLLDAGLGLGARAAWDEALAALDRTIDDVQRLLVTHHHPDHIGGTGHLHRASGGRLLLEGSPSTIAQAPDVWGDEGRALGYFAAVDAHLARHGAPQEVIDALAHEQGLMPVAVQLPPDEALAVVEPGDDVEVGGRRWRVVPTPGHADGHVVLHEPHERLLLAGDHLLERISPAVGRFPRHADDPLSSYLDSLARVRALDVDLVLPGHGEPFGGAGARVGWLLEHHAERVDACMAAVAAHAGQATAFDVARRVFARVFERDQPDAANQRFATTESLAHLVHAARLGRLASVELDDGRVGWHVAASDPVG